MAGVKSEHSLYDSDFATFEEEDVYDQRDAEGFIRLNALRLKIAHLLKKKQKKGWVRALPVNGDQVFSKWLSACDELSRAEAEVLRRIIAYSLTGWTWFNPDIVYWFIAVQEKAKDGFW